MEAREAVVVGHGAQFVPVFLDNLVTVGESFKYPRDQGKDDDGADTDEDKTLPYFDHVAEFHARHQTVHRLVRKDDPGQTEGEVDGSDAYRRPKREFPVVYHDEFLSGRRGIVWFGFPGHIV